MIMCLKKWYPWEESIRVPLVIQDPRMPPGQRGTFNEEFTLSVDLAPTVLSAAKIPVPAFMQGRDMAPLYLQPEETAKTWRQGKSATNEINATALCLIPTPDSYRAPCM